MTRLRPTDYEGFPSVVVEALAAGVPVIATDCSPAMGTLLQDRDAGHLVSVGNPIASAEAVASALAQTAPDPDRLRRSAERFRIGPAASAYIDLFRRLAEHRASRMG